MAQRMAIWNVDLLPEPIVECLCWMKTCPSEPGLLMAGQLTMHGEQPTNLSGIGSPIDPFATNPIHVGLTRNGFKSRDKGDARLCIAEDLFRMGHTQRLGVKGLAAEHHVVLL